MKADGRFSSFRKEAKGYVHFLGARKRNQKNIHPYPSSPYMERLKLRTAETDSSSCVLVSRDDAMGFLGSKSRGFSFLRKRSLIRDNDIGCKAGCMLAYMQNYN